MAYDFIEMYKSDCTWGIILSENVVNFFLKHKDDRIELIIVLKLVKLTISTQAIIRTTFRLSYAVILKILIVKCVFSDN